MRKKLEETKIETACWFMYTTEHVSKEIVQHQSCASHNGVDSRLLHRHTTGAHFIVDSSHGDNIYREIENSHRATYMGKCDVQLLVWM